MEKIKINPLIISMATACTKQYNCLNLDPAVTSPVEAVSENNPNLLKCFTKKLCSYLFSFGFYNYCGCPVRREIFRKYRK